MIDNSLVIFMMNGVIPVKKRLSWIGYGLLVVGLTFVVSGGIAYQRVQKGYDSLHAFSSAENVTLSYNDDGQLIDRGKVEGAEAIRSLLEDDWGYPSNSSDFDPNDPVINTATEYMYQMATISFHTLHGTQSVTLDEPVEYNGTTYDAGTYDVAVDGRYWTGFDRMDPLDGPAREQAWSGTVHGLIGELGVGVVTASTLQLALGTSLLVLGLGFVLGLTGVALVWASKGNEKVKVPDTIPEALTKEKIVPQPVG